MSSNILYSFRFYLSTIVFLIFILLIISFWHPQYKKSKFNNWSEILNEEINDIENQTLELFNEKIEKLLKANNRVKKGIQNFESVASEPAELIGFVNAGFLNEYDVSIYNKEQTLIAWKSDVLQIDQGSSAYNYGEVFYKTTGLTDHLVVIDTVASKTLIIGLILEKKFRINSNYYSPVSFVNELSKKFKTSIEIINNQYEDIKDGRKHAFALYNNFNNKIGTVVINKPLREVYLNSIDNSIKAIQSVIILILAVALILLVRIVVRKKQNKIIQLLVFFFFAVVLRLLLHQLGIPSNYINNSFTDPMYFSSTFGYGIVESPLEFTITAFFFFLFVLVSYRYAVQSVDKDNLKMNSNILLISLAGISAIIIYFLLFRGYAASIRSIVFDSSIRYFKHPTILPDPPSMLMLFNLLILGFCAVVFTTTIVISFLIFFRKSKSGISLMNFFWLFLIVQISGVVFDYIQNQPLGIPFLRILFITASFLIAYNIVFAGKRGIINIIYLLFSSSILSISYLTYFNTDLEIKSLKITADEITRSEESRLEYLAMETLSDIYQRKDAQNVFLKQNINYYSAAFVMWSNSSLEKEALSSNVNIISLDKKLLGYFSFQYSENFLWDWENEIINEIRIKKVEMPEGINTIIRGIAPVKYNGEVLGYIEITVMHDLYSLGFEDTPEFFSSSKFLANSPINIDQLKIFDFHNSKLVNYFTDLILSDDETEQILNVEFTKYNYAWLNIPLNNVGHVVYMTKTYINDIERVIAVALKEKNLTWNLFDFFKIFFIHSLFISLILILMYVFYYRNITRVKYSFRTKLLFAFLFISVIPLVLLAIYFRTITDEKNISAIYYKLGKRADSVESYVNDYHNKTELSKLKIFEKAATDLQINFSIYEDKKMVFSSSRTFYQIGLIPEVINPEVYKSLVKTGMREFVALENIDGYYFHSFYHKAVYDDKQYIIKVSDAFNPIQLPMKESEVDVFLFGSYSFAVILVIIFSTILANQISLPIRRLTNATRSVGKGDLNIQLNESSRGEIKDLIDGFNEMVKELRKNQADLAAMERESAWKEMAKQVAHEIKNPLTPMKLSVQQLTAAYKDKSPKFEDIFIKVTNTLIKQIETLKNIASEFSSFARMPRLQIERVDAAKTIQQTINLFSNDNIKIVLESDYSELMIRADEEQLQRTLMNLLRNSIQAGAKNVTIKCMHLNDECIIKIIDDGGGIEKEVVDKIFIEGYTTKHDGMGIGLTMAKRFVDSVNGKIFLEDTSPKKTIMVLIFKIDL